MGKKHQLGKKVQHAIFTIKNYLLKYWRVTKTMSVVPFYTKHLLLACFMRVTTQNNISSFSSLRCCERGDSRLTTAAIELANLANLSDMDSSLLGTCLT